MNVSMQSTEQRSSLCLTVGGSDFSRHALFGFSYVSVMGRYLLSVLLWSVLTDVLWFVQMLLSVIKKHLSFAAVDSSVVQLLFFPEVSTFARFFPSRRSSSYCVCNWSSIDNSSYSCGSRYSSCSTSSSSSSR